MSKTMAEVIRAHTLNAGEDHDGQYYQTCRCSTDPFAELEGEYAVHLDAALSAAGFGLVADAKAEAWDHGHHDGAVDQMLRMENDGAKTTPNPYRDAS